MDATLSSDQLWAAQVAGHAALPDGRLNARFAQVLATLAAKPLDAFPQACSSLAETKGLYRFLSNKRLSYDLLLQPLVAATVAGLAGRDKILSIQDTSSFNFSTLSGTTGLGPLNDSKRARGLHVHTTLATRGDGVPIGLLHQQCWSRPPEGRSAEQRKQRPFADKESFKWALGIRAADALLELPEDQRPRVIHVMDREGDIHEVLQEITERGEGAVIRCAQNRSVAEHVDGALHALAAAQPVAIVKRQVPDDSGKQRSARLELRSVTLTVTPDRSKHPKRQPVTWTLIEAREVDAPAGVTPLCWRLWTTEPASTRAELLEVLRIYTLRWRVEDFHLTLKSGCRVEALGLETAERLRRATLLYSAVAARIVALRDLARIEPDAPCTTILSDDAWKVLWCRHHKKALPADTPVPSVREAVLWIARLGGHLNRKGDGMPGVRTLWRGWRDLAILVAGWRLGPLVR